MKTEILDEYIENEVILHSVALWDITLQVALYSNAAKYLQTIESNSAAFRFDIFTDICAKFTYVKKIGLLSCRQT